MLRRILLIFSLLLCLSFSTVSAEHWVYITESTDETKLYVDTDDMKIDSEFGLVWIKMVNKDGSFSVSLKSFHRESHSYSDIFAFLYDKNGHNYWANHVDHKTQRIPPNSIIAAVYDFIWNGPVPINIF